MIPYKLHGRAARARRLARRLYLDAHRSARAGPAIHSDRQDAPGRTGGDLHEGQPDRSGRAPRQHRELRRRARPDRCPRSRRRPRALAGPGRPPELPFPRGLCRARPGDPPKVPPGAWVQGRGWDQNLYPDQQFPTRAALDAVAPATPVFVRRVDGHAAWANSEALRRAKVTRDTPDPPEDVFFATPRESPRESSSTTPRSWSHGRSPPPSELEVEQAILRAQELLLSQGLTSVHEMGIAPGVADVYLRLARSGQLKIRVYAHWSADPETLDEAIRRGPVRAGPDDLFTLRSIKVFADGALGSRERTSRRPTRTTHTTRDSC